MAQAIEVARFLIHLASPREDEDADFLCQMRLQKLVYYAQGWHLAVFGTPLFREQIEAWKWGPVVKDIYTIFYEHRYSSIPPKEGWDNSASLTDEEKTFISGVWEEYKQYSATALSDMTHREPPWKEARGDISPDALSDKEISLASMKDFFRSQNKAPEIPGIPVAKAYRAVAQSENGCGVTHEEVLARFRDRRE